MNKRSNIVLVIIVLYLLVCLGLYANHLKNSIELKPESFERGLEIVKGEEFVESYDLSYSHLHVSFPYVKIDGRYTNHIELSGLANTKEMVYIDVCNDTLYISYSDIKAPVLRGPDGDKLFLDIHVGGIGLKSITLSEKGGIDTPVIPIGNVYNSFGHLVSRNEGPDKYDQDDLDRYTLRFDTLDIIGGPLVDLPFLDGETLNLHKTTKSRAHYNLGGTVANVQLEYSNKGQVSIDGESLECEHVTINANKNDSGLTRGNININPTKTLTANLYGDIDVYYNTDPIVTKYERFTGRVIHLPKDW